MKEFILTLDLPFTDKELSHGIIFTKFLPRRKEAIELKVNTYNVKIYFSYEKKHLNHVSNDFIKRQKDIKRYVNILTNTLRFEINSNISNNLYELLGNEVLNKETECFCRDIMDTILKLYDLIFGFMRNILNQVWLKQFRYPLDNFGDFFLHSNAIWMYEGKLKRLYFQNNTTTITVVIDRNAEQRYMSKRAWNNLKFYLEEGKNAQTEQIFLANSLEYLDRKNTRMAILESVIALEHYVKTNNCVNIERLIPENEFEFIKKLLLKKNQFSIPIGLILAKISNKLKLRRISVEAILKSIELRNMIMHNSQKEVNYQTARKCIFNIRDFIKYLKKEKVKQHGNPKKVK